MTLDRSRISVFSCRKTLPSEDHREKIPQFELTAESNDHLSVLKDLGVRNSSVLLTNCTVWIEGVIDRMYLRHYLNLWAKDQGKVGSLVEDLHYSFVEYGGSNILHWSFLDEDAPKPERLCGKLLLIADGDNAAPKPKANRHAALTKALNDRFIPLSCNEVENLLTTEVLAAVVRDYEGDPTLTLQSFEESDYARSYLGKFIEEKVLPAGYKSKRPCRSNGPYADGSGTIKDKEAFAEKAIKHINNWSDLSGAARELTNRVAEFVESHQ